MKKLPFTPEIEAIARRVVWFEEPVVAVKDVPRFMAYAFKLANFKDMAAIRKHLDDETMKEALRKAPPGIIDPRSWSYWHLMLDMPTPPLPERVYPETP